MEKKNEFILWRKQLISSTLTIGCSWDMYLLKFSHYKSEGWFSFTQMFQDILGIINSRLIMFAKRSEKLQIPHLTSSMRPTGFFFNSQFLPTCTWLWVLHHSFLAHKMHCYVIKQCTCYHPPLLLLLIQRMDNSNTPQTITKV